MNTRTAPLYLRWSAVSERGVGPLLFALVYSLLGIALPLYILLPLPNVFGFDPARLICEGIVQFAALRLAFVAARGEPRFTTITFYVFIYVWTGLAAAAQLSVQQFPWMVVHRPDHTTTAAIMIVVAIASYELGRALVRTRVRPRARVWSIDLQVSQRAVVVVCAAAPLLVALGVVLLGDVGALFGTRARYDLAMMHLDRLRGLVAGALIRQPPFIAFVLAAHFSVAHWRHMRRKAKRTMLICMLLMALLNVIGNFPPSLIRAWLSAVVLTPLFALIRWRPLLASAWILALTVSAIIVFPYLDAFRNAPTFEAGLQSLEVADSAVEPMLHKGDYDVFQQTTNAVVYVERWGVDYGHNILGAVLFFVPRAIWPTKSPGTCFEVNIWLGYSFTNLSVPLWMEAYVAASWIGVILMLGVYGYATARAEAAYIKSLAAGGQARAAAILLPFWGAYQFFILRGDLQNVIAFSSLAVLLFVLATRTRLRRVVPRPA